MMTEELDAATLVHKAEPLTKLDVSALRKADAICFDHNVKAHNGASQIRAIKRREPTEADPYATDITHRINVESKVWSYQDDDHNLDSSVYTAFDMFHHPRDHWLTVAAFVRPGDVLKLQWIRGNSTPRLRDAGLVRDELYLTVVRGDKQSKFMLDVQVGKDNSARMTQRA